MLPNSINASEIDELCGQMPVTLLDCVFPGAGYDSVLTDYLDLAYRAAEHLFSRQHTRIGAIIGAQNGFAVSELKTGLLRAFSDYQQTPDETLLLQSECGYAQGYELFHAAVFGAKPAERDHRDGRTALHGCGSRGERENRARNAGNRTRRHR